MADKTADLTCDVAIIGAGTAGLSAERKARGAGAKTLLIDPEFAGTTCATVGCMPSKVLIAAGDTAHAVQSAAEFGIHAKPEIRGDEVMQRVRRLRDKFVAATKESIRNIPENVRVKARARFAGQTKLELSTGQTVSARAVVIATGSSPAIPEPFQDLGDRLLTNENIFEMQTLPASLGVIGAGPEGLEMAQAMARLGVDVTVLDMGDSIAGLPKGRFSDTLKDILNHELAIHTGVDVAAEVAEDAVTLSWNGASSGTARVERVLVAAGRPPNLAGLDLEAAGLDLDDDGTPVFDPVTLQCGNAPVFIAGDANHLRPLLHEASAEGAVTGRNAASFPDVAKPGRKVPLAIAFTRPCAATVGDTSRADDNDVLTAVADYGDQGRATVEARAAGMAELYADAENGRLIGATICTPGGEHLAHLLCWAIEAGLTVSQIRDMPFYHPTLEEGLKPALSELCGALEEERPWSRNDADLPGDRC